MKKRRVQPKNSSSGMAGKPIFLIAGVAFALIALFLLTHNPLSGGSNAEKGVYFFYSEYCPHCRAVKPAVLELAEKRKITLLRGQQHVRRVQKCSREDRAEVRADNGYHELRRASRFRGLGRGYESP
jgi:hypothetical protein